MSESSLAPTAIDPDSAPEAPSPAPSLTLFMKVIENDAADNYDGGKLLFSVMRAGKDRAVIASNLVISAEHDAFLMRWPWKTRAAKDNRFFKVEVTEVSYADLPPDPDAVPKKPLVPLVAPPSALSLLVQARDLALAEGNMALADTLTKQVDDLAP